MLKSITCALLKVSPLNVSKKTKNILKSTKNKEKKNVLYVPSALVFDMGSKKVVYIEGKEGVKETREVTTGEQIQNEIEITGGLKENEQILTN